MELRVMRTGDLPGAVAAWHAANIARGKPPTPQRVARVIEKLQEPDALPYVAAEGDAVVGIALVEPCREDDGAGAVIPRALHISMVFVFPRSQRHGIGGRLMRYALDAARAAGVSRVQLWTGRENTGALRLYESVGMKLTSTRRVDKATEWVRYELDL
jgi:ribosomal protein S18 acetylase RimI-like enzyme